MEYKYIPLIPKPLLKDFVNSRVIPFVGAGFSKMQIFQWDYQCLIGMR